MQPQTRDRSALRRAILALAALVSVALLAGCGAVIDTLMVVSRDGSGSRTMTLTLSAEDATKLTGGSAAADKSIRSHLPDVLEYSGLTTGGDGSLSATLTLSFDDTTDYLKKVRALLEANGNSYASVSFNVSDSTLVSGVDIEEGFSSQSLLGWLFDGLVDDGVITSDNLGKASELGKTALTFDGADIDLSSVYGGHIVASSVEDNGFAKVTMRTDISDFDIIRRTITLVGADDVDAAVYNDYLAEHTPKGATIVSSPAGTWEVSIKGDANDIAEATGIVMGSEHSAFALEAEAPEGDPASLALSLVNTASCENVCSVDAPPVVDDVSASPDLSPSHFTMDLSYGEATTMTYIPAFTSASQQVTLGFFGDVTSTTTFTVPTSAVKLVDDGFTQLLSPPKDSGTLEVSEGDQETTYTVTIAAGSADEFAAAYGAWADRGGLASAPADGGNLLWSSTYYSFFPEIPSVVGAHAITTPGPVRLSLPFGMWQNGGSLEGSLDGVVDVRIGGFTVVGLIGLGLFVLAVGIGVPLLVRNRNKLMERFSVSSFAPTAPQLIQPMARPATAAGSTLFAMPHSTPRETHAGALFALPQSNRAAAPGTLLNLRPNAVALRPRPPLFNTDVPPVTVRRVSLTTLDTE